MPAPSPATVPVGGIPISLAVAPDGSAVYVTTFTSSAVGVLDPVAGQLVATIPVGSSPRGLAMSPDGATLYVACLGSDSVSVVDTAKRVQTATVKVGRNPQGVALSADGSRLYVTNSGGDPKMPGSLGIYTTADRAQVGPAITVGAGPVGVGASVDGLVFVANSNSNSVTVVQDAGNPPAVVATLQVGPNPRAVAVHRDDTPQAYVTHYGADSVSVLRTLGGGAGAIVTATPTVGLHPYDIAVSSDGAFVYVANSDSGTLSVLTVPDLAQTTVPVGGHPSAIALLPEGGTYVVADDRARTVRTANRSFTPLGGRPVRVAVAGDRGYVTNADAHTLDVVDLRADPPTPLTRLDLGDGSSPSGLAIIADGRTALVSRWQTGDVAMVDLTADPLTITGTVPVGSGPGSVAVTPDGRRAFVVRQGGNAVVVLDLTVSPPQTVATLDVDGPSAVAVSPDGARAFVTQSIARENVTIIDCTADPPQVVTAVGSGGIAPSAVAVTPDARWVLVVTTDPSGVAVLDNTADPPARRDGVFAITQSGLDIAVSPDGRQAYVACSTLEFDSPAPLAVLDLALEENRTPGYFTIPVGRGASGVAVTADGARVVVAHGDHRRRGVAAVPVPGRLPAGQQPRDVVVAHDGSRLYVADEAGSVVLVDPAAPPGTLFATVHVGRSPGRLAITPDDRLLVVTEYGSRALFLVPTTAGPPRPPIALPDVPYGLALGPDGRSCYVTLSATGDLLGLDLGATPPRTTFRLPAVGGEIALTANGTRAYLSRITDQTVTIVDLTATPPQIIGTVPVGGSPGSLALTPDGTRLYAVVDDGVVAVATATRTVTRLPLTLFRPMRAAVSPDGRSLLVTGDTGPGTIWTIDVATSEIIQVTTPAGGYPTGIAFSPDGTLSYLTEALPAALAVRPVRNNTYVP